MLLLSIDKLPCPLAIVLFSIPQVTPPVCGTAALFIFKVVLMIIPGEREVKKKLALTKNEC
jgi:hypothetical protein